MPSTITKQLQSIVKEPKQTADAVVIWLHGLGDSAKGFSDVVPVLKLSSNHRIRFVFPNAPQQPVTINGGYVMRSWYDIKTMDLEGRADLATLQQSELLIKQLVAEQINSGIKSERIIIAGFSQGGVLALYTGLRLKQKVAGIAGLSCYLAEQSLPTFGSQAINSKTPIFSSHGEQDMTVPFSAGKEAARQLADAGFNVQWSQYPMEHWVCEPQLNKLGQWIEQALA
ncbi:alpha/beta hydrolase [Psychrobium sp. 1_MG-2023]|uniref:alpha/beta hydrolase n=1 Tax=Psychrobium sp. 1_MG-2023 TaxID=3062624 RepID=UPI000C343E04|nr:dienelactone hydrolase family protein [Psychrobium sp. 1_MG-2023]MDP2562012.1 dienelactone hydrolase family protein [Psychrobium sp. 1_MG-2023]PKF58608.1 carboxylesterase [Alteromonadales bacterium alter-6D02]